MSNADKIFEDLEYEKGFYFTTSGKLLGISYKESKTLTEIIFDLQDKDVCISDMDDQSIYISIQELQAINEKCKELGWL